MTPFLILFSVYLLVHGHYGPGGGFQAGALLGLVAVFARLVQGREAKWNVSLSAAVVLACVGGLVCLMYGMLSFAWGGNFLDYGVLPIAGSPAEARALGILIFEGGVTLAVMGVIAIMFDLLTGDGGRG